MTLAPTEEAPAELSPEERLYCQLLALKLLELNERDWCLKHPAYLIDRMSAVDEREADGDAEASVFRFNVLTREERAAANAQLVVFYGEDERDWPHWLGWRTPPGPSARTGRSWFWQREVLDEWLSCTRWIGLKARQLGITWTACALTGWTLLYRPGSRCLHFRQKEDDVIDNVQMTFQLMRSLPQHLWDGAKTTVPDLARTSKPTVKVEVLFKDGRSSVLQGMTSAADSGHGKRAALIVLDEYSRIEAAASITKAANSAAGSKGRMLVISTANGVSNPETGDGNRFHWLWVNALRLGYVRRFLPWSLHPERDEAWYESDPEILGLKSWEQAEQYPATPDEAFTLTNTTYFDAEDLLAYARLVREPLYRFDFVDPDNPERLAKGSTARVVKYVAPRSGERHRPNAPNGNIAVYLEPVDGHKYAIGADVASATGRDYSVAYVVDLSTMELVCEFRARLDEDLYAAQLHYMGRMYGRTTADENGQPGFALLAVETQGGYGNAVIAPLRDRTAGRPVYTNLWRNRLENRMDVPTAKPFGFPMNSATRPKAFNQLDQALRQRTLPWVTASLMAEMRTFVHHQTGVSPAAQQGTNDDCVMACAIALELYRAKGEHAAKQTPKQRKSRARRGLGRVVRAQVDLKRYPKEVA